MKNYINYKENKSKFKGINYSYYWFN